MNGDTDAWDVCGYVEEAKSSLECAINNAEASDWEPLQILARALAPIFEQLKAVEMDEVERQADWQRERAEDMEAAADRNSY